MQFTAKQITKETLRAEVQKYFDEGYRLVTMSQCVTDEDHLDLLYHFDKELSMEHLRLTVKKGEPIPSISPIYFSALLVENESQDMFGLKFDDLVLDYNGGLYLEGEVTKAPYFKMTTVTKVKG